MKPMFVVLAAAFAAGPALAQDRNDVIAQKLYSKLESALGASDPTAPVRTDALILATPGYVIDTAVDYNTPDGSALLSNLIDRSVAPAWRLRLLEDGNTTSAIYNSILSNHVVPAITLTPVEKQQLAAAQGLVYATPKKKDFSPAYLAFEGTRTKYYGALEALEDWQRVHPHQTAPVGFTSDVQKTKARWDLLGRRQEMLAALSVIETYENRDPAVYWGSLRAKFDTNQSPLGTSTYPTYNFYPTYPTWIGSTQNWTKVAITEADLNTIATSSHVSWGGSASASWDLWSVGGGYGETTDRTSLSVDGTNISVAFEVLRVQIQRPWMEGPVFGARTWDWAEGSSYDRRTISDGPMNGATLPSGVAPLLAVELLLARNVALSGTWNTDLKATYHNQKTGGGHVGWGPFSFGGNYNSSYDETKDHTQVNGNTITSPDVQIIGVLVRVLPRTPDADRAHYKWTDRSISPTAVSLKVGPFTLSGAAASAYKTKLDTESSIGKRATSALAAPK